MTRGLAFLALFALAACVQSGAEAPMLSDPPMPAAGQTAFQRAHDRLAYRDARIGHDRDDCITYDATDNDGRAYSQSLLDPEGRRICLD